MADIKSDYFKVLACPLDGNYELLKEGEGFRCSKCDAVFPLKDQKIFFTKPPSDFKSGDIRIDATDKKYWTIWRQANYRFFKERLGQIPKEGLVLDLGIGRAYFSDLLKPFKVVGADFVPYEAANVICDITKTLPFKNQSFDLIFASNTLEHLPNNEEVLKEIYRIFKPGGQLIGTIPFLLNVHQKPYDFVRYTHLMLEKLLKEASFKDVEVVALGDSFDAYFQSQRRFFFMLYDSVALRKTWLTKKLWWITVKAIWFWQKAVNFLLSPIFRRCLKTRNFTMGYGFVGKK